MMESSVELRDKHAHHHGPEAEDTIHSGRFDTRPRKLAWPSTFAAARRTRAQPAACMYAMYDTWNTSETLVNRCPRADPWKPRIAL